MKKFLLFAAVLYFASCATLCGGEEEQPTDANVCYAKETTDKEKFQCCFLKNTTATSCHEFEAKTTAEEIKKAHKEYEKYDFILGKGSPLYKGDDRKTSATYLKAGFLFAAMLLL